MKRALAAALVAITVITGNAANPPRVEIINHHTITNTATI